MPDERHPFFEFLDQHFDHKPWEKDAVPFGVVTPKWNRQRWSLQGFNPNLISSVQPEDDEPEALV